MNGNGSSGLSRMEYSKLRIASSKFPVELNVSQFGRLKTPNGNVETPGKSTKARHWWAFPALPQWPSRTPDCVAGDAVLIAPVSNGIPCKQGILQGIPREFSLEETSPVQEMPELQRLPSCFPAEIIREIFSREQGSWRGKQGN
jgi:hypothetical protein